MKKVTGLDCIILVDDDRITNFINKKVIKRADIDVAIKVNNSVIEALSYLKGMSKNPAEKYPRPGIIFLDINMPGMNGWDFINEYKKLPKEQKERIVIAMLTTSANPDDEFAANQIPEINMFLKKPLTVEKLESTIDSYFPIT
ncbi:response regulator [Aquimarina sp. MMG016]|uniref:response regulator n=1 Tax=Aquimarina sp. MMG016 TaxID=2822690 RepID=UPI001B3A5AE2|nr:response regulator [Aquimarina sp. MMG016]MBQ4820299.1 response regulator [Aquimarina sp. MMG016]